MGPRRRPPGFDEPRPHRMLVGGGTPAVIAPQGRHALITHGFSRGWTSPLEFRSGRAGRTSQLKSHAASETRAPETLSPLPGLAGWWELFPRLKPWAIRWSCPLRAQDPRRTATSPRFVPAGRNGRLSATPVTAGSGKTRPSVPPNWRTGRALPLRPRGSRAALRDDARLHRECSGICRRRRLPATQLDR